MTWAKLDDGFHSHPKVRYVFQQSRASIGLHVMGIAFSADYETDGKVPEWFVEGVLPMKRERLSALDALLESGLWIRNGDGFVIHDFLEYNPSREQLSERREKDRVRKVSERNPDGR